jgi:hypothetical protein
MCLTWCFGVLVVDFHVQCLVEPRQVIRVALVQYGADVAE